MQPPEERQQYTSNEEGRIREAALDQDDRGLVSGERSPVVQPESERSFGACLRAVRANANRLNMETAMNPTPVSAEDAKAMQDRGERVVFVDARNPVAWGTSTVKLPGAVRIPVDAVDEHLAELPRDAAAVITYCT